MSVVGDFNLTFGSFDGLHLGHRAVISRLVSLGCPSAVVCVNYPEAIYTPGEKELLLRELGVKRVCHISAEEVEGLTAMELCSCIEERFDPKCIVAGENLCFGKDKRGVDALIDHGFSVKIVPTIKHGGRAVTHQTLLDAIADNDFTALHTLMGSRYIISGKVVHGKGKGSKHRMPTANLEIGDGRILPPHGVYGVMTVVDGERRMGATNIGLRPAADDMPHPTVETYIPNFSGDLYGREMLLELKLYVRGVMDFTGGIDDVRRQVEKDLQRIEAYFSK